MTVDKRELHATPEGFVSGNENTDQIWNTATISGMIILFLTSVYLLQTVLGIHWGPDMSSLIDILPVIGGILLIIVGFGFLTGKNKADREEAYMLHNDMERERSEEEASFDEGETEKDAEPRKHSQTGEADSRHSSSSYSSYSDPSFKTDPYAMRQRKKLYKSRTDKKISGVCGGLGAYFDVSSTVIRLLFVVLTLVGVGSALILYIVLWIVLKKEPAEETEKVHIRGR